MDSKTCSLCLLKEPEVEPFLRELKQKHPTVAIEMTPSLGSLFIQCSSQETSEVEQIIEALRRRFPTFFFESPRHQIVEVLHREMIVRKKTLALAESCTGGAIAARITSLPDASRYFLGSFVVYSNQWKERFLQVSHTTLKQAGAVSRETVEEMIRGVFHETDADYAIAVSGIAGPGGGSTERPVGTVWIAVAERGKPIDSGALRGPTDRASFIEWTVQTSLGALWRRLVHHVQTFS